VNSEPSLYPWTALDPRSKMSPFGAINFGALDEGKLTNLKEFLRPQRQSTLKRILGTSKVLHSLKKSPFWYTNMFLSAGSSLLDSDAEKSSFVSSYCVGNSRGDSCCLGLLQGGMLLTELSKNHPFCARNNLSKKSVGPISHNIGLFNRTTLILTA